MKTLTISIFLGLFHLFGTAQTDTYKRDFQTIASYYSAIGNPVLTSKMVKDLESKLTWKRVPYIDSIHDRYTITLEEILLNEWVQVEVTDLKFKYSIDNTILVTGIYSGRKPSGCDYVSSTFEHTWTKRDDLSHQITNNSKN